MTASQSSCSRDVSSSVAWITISLGASGTGNGTIAYSVAANTTALARTGTLTIGNTSFTVSEAGLPCNLTLSPSGVSAAAAGASGTIAVTATPGCAWTASSPVPWVTLSPASGSGNGTVNYTVAANTGASSRSTQVTVGGQILSVTQVGTSCSYTLTPGSAIVSGAAGTGSFNVTSGCSWTAASNASWLTISSGASGNGNGTVNYAAAANAGPGSRTGMIAVGSQSFAVTQNDPACTFALTPASASIAAQGGSSSIGVATASGCAWAASTSASWITLTNASASGAGVVVFSVAANATSATRGAAIAIADQTFMVTQAAAGAGPAISAIVNAASYTQGGVSPGEIVTIFGSGMGPDALVPLALTTDGSALTTSLAGTQVLFDGVPAPMIYTSAGQVSAIVPYEVAGAQSTRATVTYQGEPSAAMTLAVTASAPGIFSIDSSGSGPGAILNQDYSVNSAANPAARGSVVMIYATGEGQTQPAGRDGVITGATLATPALGVSAEIGGVPATVLYAGSAPGLVAGVLQVNVVLPDGVGVGVVPVVVTVGGVTSQGSVTVAVK